MIPIDMIDDNKRIAGDLNDINCFKMCGLIGQGCGGKVYLALNVHTKQQYAIKVGKISKRSFHNYQREIDVLRSIKHDNIVAIRGVIENTKATCWVMDFMNGGDLLEDLHKNKKYTEARAREVTTGILNGVSYFHEHGIVHRDLKPENILLDKCGKVKIIDFGLSTRVSDQEFLTTKCGTITYMAPEVLRGEPYGRPVDVWGVGVTMFIMLGGYHPFHEPNLSKNNILVMKGCYKFYESHWRGVSCEAKIMIHNMLRVLPTARLTSKQALNSSWLREDDELTGSFFASRARKYIGMKK